MGSKKTGRKAEAPAGVTIGEAHMRAHKIAKDPELVRLTTELEAVEAELKETERRVPEHVRDLDTLEAHLRGRCDEVLEKLMSQFLISYAPLKEYSDLLERKWDLEERILARRTELGVPPY